MIHFSGRVERLVIETSFLGAGTNFAWVVPLPSVPEVKPVSENFFRGLQQAFQPTLIHRVLPYYAGVLFVCGLAFLGSRSLKDETSFVTDLPLCLLLATGAGLVGKHVGFGVAAAILLLCMRTCARSPAAFGLILLVGTVFAAGLTFMPAAQKWSSGLVQTLGSDGQTEEIAGATVLSSQRAGIFDVTTIRGANPGAVREWLTRNGYQAPVSAEPAIRDYVQRGWVFVASKARRPAAETQLASLHPLAFTFSTTVPVYPTKLTAIDNGSCSIDLYVFGSRRASAGHFGAVRCDRLATDQGASKKLRSPGLRILDPEVLALIGNSSVGTKLSGNLTPAQMASDVQIASKFFWRTGARVYSTAGALSIALNVALPLAALAWLLVGASRDGWSINERWVSRWRKRLLAVSIGIGLALFLMLPKAEVETRSQPPSKSYSDDGLGLRLDSATRTRKCNVS